MRSPSFAIWQSLCSKLYCRLVKIDSPCTGLRTLISWACQELWINLKMWSTKCPPFASAWMWNSIVVILIIYVNERMVTGVVLSRSQMSSSHGNAFGIIGQVRSLVDFHHKWQVMWNLKVSVVILSKLLNKQSRYWWFETPRRSCLWLYWNESLQSRDNDVSSRPYYCLFHSL